MNLLHKALAISVILPLIACGKSNERPIDTAGVSQSATPNKPAPQAEWVVTERGFGRLHAGMTIAEARALFPDLKVPNGAETTSCDYAGKEGLPPGIAVMVGKGRIRRVDVNALGVVTAEGGRIGDSEDRIKALYPGRVKVSPHEYTDGHYLTVEASSKPDSGYRIVFETDRSRVVRYRAGILPHVGYVEGCS